MSGFFEFIRTSFWHVAPILIAGAIAVAIAAERARALFSIYPIRDSQGFFDKITDLVLAGKFNEAVALCDRLQAKPVARVAKEALLRAHQPESLIENGLQIAVGDATQAIQKRTVFLSTIANVATLLGLLGTIAGLIASFEAVGHADPQQKSALLAAGISTAMNATMMGLGVAIPCMIAFSFLMNRTNRLLADIDQSAMRVMDILKQRYYQAETSWTKNEHAGDAPAANGHDKVRELNPARRSA
jgi:biopolymer transport protein ExbB/TolQ